MLTDGSLSPLCHLTGQHSERLFLLFFSAGVGQLLPWPPPPWKRLKAILRPNVLEICLGLARACRDDAGCTLLLFFFCHFLLLSPRGSSIGWLQPLQAGVTSSPGSRGTDTGEDMHWMDGTDGGRIG